jgi:hypothetical protein
LFVWFGTESNQRERNKGRFIASKLNEEQFANSAPIVLLGSFYLQLRMTVIEDGKEKEKKVEAEEFWREVGGKGTIASSKDGGNDIDEERNTIMTTKLFRY